MSHALARKARSSREFLAKGVAAVGRTLSQAGRAADEFAGLLSAETLRGLARAEEAKAAEMRERA